MAKIPKKKQLVVRMDGDISEAIEKAAVTFKRSRAVIIAAALHHFTQLTGRKQRAVIVDYSTRDLPEPETKASK